MLDKDTLFDIKDLFCEIRSFAYSKDVALWNDIAKKIEANRYLINACSTGFQRSVFDYCFCNLLNLIQGQQEGEILFDFADAIHNIGDVFHCEVNESWNFYIENFWNVYIEPFRRKYGEHFFIDFEYDFKNLL